MKTLKATDYGFQAPENFTGILEFPGGIKHWYLDGELHRESAPAVVNDLEPDGYQEWHLNGQLHRLDGPAYVDACLEKHYWIHGKKIEDENAFNLFVNIMKLKGLTTPA